jgi:hypothetical protein
MHPRNRVNSGSLYDIYALSSVADHAYHVFTTLGINLPNKIDHKIKSKLSIQHSDSGKPFKAIKKKGEAIEAKEYKH